jgi:hypothetical protein
MKSVVFDAWSVLLWMPSTSTIDPSATFSSYTNNPQSSNFPSNLPIMGNDGGSIPTRRELVKEAAKALTTQQVKEVQQESQEHAWNHDPLSRKPLSSPVVSDSAGILYNKDSIIEFLLAEEKDVEQEKVLDGRVKGLKDVVEVKFEVDGADAEVKGTGARREKWVCPITREEMGMNVKAVYLVPCGHAFAGSVVREVDERVCVQVGISGACG